MSKFGLLCIMMFYPAGDVETPGHSSGSQCHLQYVYHSPRKVSNYLGVVSYALSCWFESLLDDDLIWGSFYILFSDL